jgi:prolipoprotein diacylglyceryltransferase
MVARLWLSGAEFTIIIGIYFILTGFGRFVEESYRGEPQTPRFAGLSLYQIVSVLMVLAGIGVTMVRNAGQAPDPRFDWEAVAASAFFAVFVFFAFGVDFPNSNRRFARLA